MASTSAAGQAHPCGSNLLFVCFGPQPKKSAAARSQDSNKKWPRSPGTGGVWWGQDLPEDSNSYMSQAALIEAWLSQVSSARVPASMARCWLVQVQWGPLRCWLLCRPQVPAFRGGPQGPPTPHISHADLESCPGGQRHGPLKAPCRPNLAPQRPPVRLRGGIPPWYFRLHFLPLGCLF